MEKCKLFAMADKTNWPNKKSWVNCGNLWMLELTISHGNWLVNCYIG